METQDWQADGKVLGAALYRPATAEDDSDRVVVWINGGSRAVAGWVPDARDGWHWRRLVDSARLDNAALAEVPNAPVNLAPRSVVVLAEFRDGRD